MGHKCASESFLLEVRYFSEGMYLLKCERSLISLEASARLLDILIPRSLLLITKIRTPIIISEAVVVSENRTFSTRYSTMKG